MPTYPFRWISARSSQFFELRITIYLVSKKTIVNSFVMFFLAVNSFATSLPRVEGDMVLFLCFSFTVPSTMGSPLLGHVVRERESIQSPVVKFFFWIRFQPRGVRKCNVSRNSNNSTLPHFTNHLLRIFTKWVVDVILLQVGLKCFSMRITLDLLHELLNAAVFGLFHNCM